MMKIRLLHYDISDCWFSEPQIRTVAFGIWTCDARRMNVVSTQVRELVVVSKAWGNPSSEKCSFCLITAVFGHWHLLQSNIDMRQCYCIIVGLQTARGRGYVVAKDQGPELIPFSRYQRPNSWCVRLMIVTLPTGVHSKFGWRSMMAAHGGTSRYKVTWIAWQSHETANT